MGIFMLCSIGSVVVNMSPVKMLAGEMAEKVEAEKAERKRLKKLAKAKAALAEVTNITKDNDAPDWTLTKKEKKKRKEMALADASNVSLESTDELNNKKR